MKDSFKRLEKKDYKLHFSLLDSCFDYSFGYPGYIRSQAVAAVALGVGSLKLRSEEGDEMFSSVYNKGAKPHIWTILGEPIVISVLKAAYEHPFEMMMPISKFAPTIGFEFQIFLAYYAPALFKFVVEKLKGTDGMKRKKH